eukprot:CAMPEP_0117038990 /NCGR_PEP_ID=MMETSP0472-20121206/27393_1 /TAXON_ID=693140 ORGANISM="Tiarina fusus, Strain LIS" /NCGR_SAMPLE_ID=MMETSP0472 /ASSEMBLY_ACC=CAM_ASM_000603 /LENGTH=108 /DNA_ID=CAMNT_0004749357 /DNA_START=111 /DNA_END=437 /DNA_ORIENTATION=+
MQSSVRAAQSHSSLSSTNGKKATGRSRVLSTTPAASSVIGTDLYEPSFSYLQSIKPIQERRSSMASSSSTSNEDSTSSSSLSFLQEAADNFPFDDEEERHFMDRPSRR